MTENVDIKWAQLILIELGAMFQIAALYAGVKNSHDFRATRRMIEAEEVAERAAEKAAHAREDSASLSEAWHPESDDSTVRPSELLETTKIQFEQSFLARHGNRHLSTGDR